MSHEYDFDIVKKALDDFDSEPQATGHAEATQVRALFRDVRTADALRMMSPKIRKMFLDAGFGLDANRSGIASGVYPPEDAPDRERILLALFANIKSRGVQGEYCGEFDLWEFLDHVRTARPKKGVIRSAPVQQREAESQSTTPKRRPASGRIGFSLGLAVLLFAMFKYLAQAGVTP